MSDFLTKFSGPIIAAGWGAFGIIIIAFIGAISLISAFYNIFKDAAWSYGIPAPIAFLIFPILVILFFIAAWFIIQMAWLFAVKKRNEYASGLTFIEGEIVE